MRFNGGKQRQRKIRGEREMRRMRNAVLIAILTALIATPLIGGSIVYGVGEAQEKAAKVAYAPIPGGDYKIDPAHSIIGFSIRHLEINWVEGRFKDFKGTIRFNDSDITKSSVEFEAQIESIDTGVEARDKHLRTADFFDAQKYPAMTFKSTRVERKGKDSYVLYGDFTLKGVTKQQALLKTPGAIRASALMRRPGLIAAITGLPMAMLWRMVGLMLATRSL
jgi:polyisoprenoid-binding protein YceI